MPKAILELEMPENCGECRLKCYDWTIGRYCTFTNKPLTTEYKEKREAACPLKLADGDCRKAEWVNGKCRGFQVSRWDDEPIEKCKNCKDFEEYKGVEQE